MVFEELLRSSRGVMAGTFTAVLIAATGFAQARVEFTQFFVQGLDVGIGTTAEFPFDQVNFEAPHYNAFYYIAINASETVESYTSPDWLGELSTDRIYARITTDVDGSSGSKSASAESSVEDVFFQIAGISFSADLVRSTASVGGDEGAFNTDVLFEFENAELFVDGNEITLPTSFTVEDGESERLTLFEDEKRTIAIEAASLSAGSFPTASAGLTFTLNGALQDETALYGTLDLATSSVMMSPVPEPASMAALGLGALGLLARRRRTSR